jgi:Holliday junction resolvase
VSAANKAKGSRWERDLEEYLNAWGSKCRRLPRAGSKDIGDLAIELKSGRVIVIEAKDVRTPAMADWLRQATVEAINYEDKYKVSAYGMVAVKARQRGVGDARITLTVDELLNLLKWEGLS